MVENFSVIQLTFSDIFVPQDSTIRTTSGLSGPADTCARRDTSIPSVSAGLYPAAPLPCHLLFS